MNNLLEAAGYALVVGFLWFVWPPLTLLGAGVLLVVVANVRANRPQSAGRVVARLGAALAAGREAYRREQGALRRVA